MDGTRSPSDRENDETGVKPWEFAHREALSPYIFGRILILIGLYLAAYTALCPFGDDLTWTQYLAYFGLCVALCAPVCHAEYVVTLYVTRIWTPCRITMAVAAATFITAPTSTAIAYGVDTLLRKKLPAHQLPTVYLFMTLSVLLCTAVVHYLVSQRLKTGSASGTGTDEVAEPALPEPPDNGAAIPMAAGRTPEAPPYKFLDRLPREVGSDIIYLKMRDHYVEVVTTAGRCAVLMRFADAVAELGGHGIRVHRSYWAAYPHIKGWARSGQRPSLQLTDDHVVPVSRTYLGDVRAALARHRAGADSTDRNP